VVKKVYGKMGTVLGTPQFTVDYVFEKI